MLKSVLTAGAVTAAGPALAHSGAHLHPHDGASWLTMVAALAVLAVAGGLAVARKRTSK
ncbi:hypothetical protein [Primorskyibacter sp. 2E233]|uniref:hypothetical protein n=1 Tax=Primorskyibacter sp. 2E233 TaxID=3413431 RepID=UPI003BF02970